jgi:heme/copper-type cytochrome/quinol oxidase subunit 2
MILNGAMILIGVIGTLAYFHFGARQKADGSVKRNFLVEILTWIGRIYIAITFGVLFAGVYMAALTALIGRVDSLRTFIILVTQSL